MEADVDRDACDAEPLGLVFEERVEETDAVTLCDARAERESDADGDSLNDARADRLACPDWEDETDARVLSDALKESLPDALAA